MSNSMKRILKTVFYRTTLAPSKALYRFSFVMFTALHLFVSQVYAQCPSGFTRAHINWDNLDYLPGSNANYTSFFGTPSIGAWVNKQLFAFGTQRLTFSTTGFATTDLQGENTTHTVETGSYGAGSDVLFSNNGTIILSFDNEVQNLRFSLYDVDRTQQVSFTAVNTAGVAQNITVARAAGTFLNITGSGGTAPVVTTTSNTNQSNTAAGGEVATVNVDVAGPVKRISIVISGTISADFGTWLSDISACTNVSAYATNYYQVARPLPGQPAYVLSSPDNDTVYAINPLTGATQYLFDMPGSPPPFVNGIGYDPVKKIMYYIQENNWPGTSVGGPDFRSLYRYDFDTETGSLVNADLRTRGAALFSRNVQSGSSAFYDGKLYFGVEGGGGTNTTRESIVWRFDPEIAGDSAVQVYARPADNGTRAIVDWGDIAINNGVMFDFNAIASDSDYVHYDLWNQNILVRHFPPSFLHVPRQAATQWDGAIVNIGDSVCFYNGNGTLTLPKVKITGNNWRRDALYNGNLNNTAAGDAAGAFRPKMDFGDAPASYYSGLDTAAHERDINLRLGSSFDREWNAPMSFLANADDLANGGDEDAIGSAPILMHGGVLTYNLNNISVFNNTGANATLTAWLDFNFNGQFEASEGRSITVSSSASSQLVNLSWVNITVPNAGPASQTYLRIRITRAANSMTTAHFNRYLPDGEVEDYRVIRGGLLSANSISFNAVKNSNDKIILTTVIADISNIKEYEIERSADGINWKTIIDKQSGISKQNTDEDNNPGTGKIYYRAKLLYKDGSSAYTTVATVLIENKLSSLSVFPNPAVSVAQVGFVAEQEGKIIIEVYHSSGKLMRTINTSVVKGANRIAIDGLDKFPAGMYTVYTVTEHHIAAAKLLIIK